MIKPKTGELCNNETKCFCVGDVCIVGGDCWRGNTFVRGKPICDDRWDNTDANVFCQSIGYLRARRFTAESK